MAAFLPVCKNLPKGNVTDDKTVGKMLSKLNLLGRDS